MIHGVIQTNMTLLILQQIFPKITENSFLGNYSHSNTTKNSVIFRYF